MIHNYADAGRDRVVDGLRVCAGAPADRIGSSPHCWRRSSSASLRIACAHIGHLELQWTMWMPLAMLLLHRADGEADAVARRPAGRGAGRAGAVAASITACFWRAISPRRGMALRAVRKGERTNRYRERVSRVVPLLLVAVIYGPPYLRTSETIRRSRRLTRCGHYSAVPADYLRVPQENVLRGRQRRSGVAPDERSLFPGFIAICPRDRSRSSRRSRDRRWTYLVLGARRR